MKLLSISAIITGAKRVINRFPVAMLAAAAATAVMLYVINIEEDITSLLLNLLLTLSLACPLYVAAVLMSEAKKLSNKCHWGLHSIILVFLIGYYFFLPNMEVAHEIFYVRHAMWTIGFVLVITFISFLFQKQTTAIKRFWDYNRELIVAVVLTGVWAIALMAGISAALGAIDFLFELRMDEKVYASLWATLLGIFAPFFFLARLPQNPHALASKKDYPKEVRLFSQYALTPLVTVYFLILYAYTAKIVILFDWPEGQLAWIILGFSFVGVLTYLALHPLRETENWVRKFGTGLFAAMIPQTGMLFWALSFRLAEYGFTENRYFVLIFGIWLLAMAVYYLIAKVKDIRIIPITLFIFAVLTSFGPWSAFSVAEHSQINRLEGILVANNLLVDGLYVQPITEIPIEDEVQVNEIVTYLKNRHGLDGIEPWFGGEDLDALSTRRWDIRETVVEDKFGMSVRYPYEIYRDDPEAVVKEMGYLSVYTNPFEGKGYALDTYTHIAKIETYDDIGELVIDEKEYDVVINQENTELTITHNAETFLTFDLIPLIELGKKDYARDLKDEDATIVSTDGSATLIVTNLYGSWEKDGTVDIDHLAAFLLF